MSMDKTKSRILDAVHETAGDLYRLGFIDQSRLRKYELLCLKPISEHSAVPGAAEHCDEGTTSGD